ncbi:IS21 family transposase [Rhabdothermincola sediminis]|uniref:IS21 family transposase n=1 Tax=Rhabdothermincola sediminis TaxID=2751370 RepID=UPI001AA041FD|nr:IS21 family transposase [Rhabdothermincola sediminis]
MLTPEEDVEITSLKKRGWSISAIARHTGRDRKTVRAYVNGEREPGVRDRAEPDRFDRFEPYVRQRLVDDPHVRATVLFAEVVGLGFDRSYPTFTRQVRDRQLRPHCEPCASSNGRAHVDIEHPPGEEVQWDWLELVDTPWGEKAFVLVGALSHSGQFRGWFSDSDDQAHLVVGIDEVLRRLGGTPKRWRVDRMATVINPQTGTIQRSFAPVAKHYGVGVDPCPPRHGNRKGVVEKAIDYLTQSWWRTARVATPAEAQASLDAWCAGTADERRRDGSTVGELAATEPLLGLPPAPYPAEVTEVRTVAANALVSLWGNRYSVPPGLVGGHVQIRWRLGEATISVHAQGRQVCVHRLAPRGSQQTVRLPEHTAALENVVLDAFNTDKPCRRKVNRPPSDAALALAAEIVGEAAAADPVIDLDVYRRLIDGEDVG